MKENKEPSIPSNLSTPALSQAFAMMRPAVQSRPRPSIRKSESPASPLFIRINTLQPTRAAKSPHGIGRVAEGGPEGRGEARSGAAQSVQSRRNRYLRRNKMGLRRVCPCPHGRPKISPNGSQLSLQRRIEALEARHRDAYRAGCLRRSLCTSWHEPKTPPSPPGAFQDNSLP